MMELLSPAGSREALIAAVQNGADAVYFGGSIFNARRFAANFDDHGLISAIDYCHERGVKVNITLNTLLLDKEISKALKYAEFLCRTGADAAIVQDMGLVSLIRKNIPELPLHASTQMGIHELNGAREAEATALDGSGACVDAKGNHVMKPFWKMTDADIKACLNATDWCRADYEYFRGGGYSSHFRCKAEMPVTMLRFNIVEGIGPVLQIAEGWTADLPDEIHNTIDKRTDPTCPTTWFCPRLTGQGAFTDVYSVMANWGANHGVTVYGHVGADLITLASMLRIPVTMHNVPAEKIYRPHAWASFGTQDQQAADYAACKQYGPLYR